jgi:hypothetical protein
VIPRASRNDELTLVVHGFSHFYPILNQQAGIEKGGLVTDELGADLGLVRKLGFGKSLEDWIVVEINSIPELGPPMVKIVDTIEVKVFFVPSEHGLPRTNIDIGRIYSRYFLITQPPPKQHNTVSTYDNT